MDDTEKAECAGDHVRIRWDSGWNFERGEWDTIGSRMLTICFVVAESDLKTPRLSFLALVDED